MLRNFLTVITLLLISSNLVAKDNMFTGIEIGKTKVTALAKGYHYSSDTISSLSVKYGKEYMNNSKIYAKYLNARLDDRKIKAITVHYDKYLTRGQIRPFIGAGIGYMVWENNYVSNINAVATTNPIDITKWEPSGITYGMNIGLLIKVTKQLTFELGYEYMKTLAKDTYCDITEIGVCTEAEIIDADLDSYDHIKVGMNFSF
jgi:opacity protein-like surface antigen